MNKLAISCDLDDTIMPNHFSYTEAKNNVAKRIIKDNPDLTKGEIINKIDNNDIKRHRENGITKDRFANALIDTVEFYYDDCTEEVREFAQIEGMRPVKTPDEYNNVGKYDGWNILKDTIDELADIKVLITAGAKSVQDNKIDGLNIRDYFNTIHIVDSGKKSKPLEDLSYKYETVVHIGNSLESDIKPAEKVGINAIHIQTSDWRSDYDVKNNSKVWKTENLDGASAILKNKYS